MTTASTDPNFQTPVNDPLSNRQPGLREVNLLLVAAGFMCLMFDLHEIALIADLLAVALWLVTMTIGPRPSPVVTMAIGAGIFVTTFWWPKENWWHLAIGLMWAGLAIVVTGFVAWILQRKRATGRNPRAGEARPR